MSGLSLRDNALFMLCFRERTRPQMLLAAAAAAGLLIIVIVGTCYINDSGGRNAWAGWAFGAVAIAQGGALMFGGCFSVGQVTSRELKNRTLDFHRISPTPRIHQVIGLVLGAPILEWCTVAATFPISVLLALVARVPILDFLSLYAGIIVSALLAHSLSVALGLASKKTLKLGREQAIGVAMPIGLLLLSGATIMIGAASLYHLTSLPLYIDVLGRVFQVSNTGGPDAPPWELLNTLFHVKLPSLVLIVLVQVPFMIMSWIAAIRAISHPDRPPFSKLGSLGLLALIFTFFVGDALPILAEAADKKGLTVDHGIMGIFLYAAMVLGLWGAWTITPHHFLHVKGLRRMKKLGHTILEPFSDAGTNLTWFAGYVLLFAAAYGALLYYLADSVSAKLLAMAPVTALLYVLWPAQALEYFRLSRFRSFKTLFAICLGIPWFFLPLFAMLTLSILQDGLVAQLLITPSPFFGLAAMILSDTEQDIVPLFPLITVGVNGVLASVGIVLCTLQIAEIRTEEELQP